MEYLQLVKVLLLKSSIIQFFYVIWQFEMEKIRYKVADESRYQKKIQYHFFYLMNLVNLFFILQIDFYI